MNSLNRIFNLVKLVSFFLLWLLPAVLIAEENIPPFSQDEQEINETTPKKENAIDSTHRNVSSTVGSISRFIDSLFQNPNYTAEEADGRFSLYQSFDTSKQSTMRFRTRIKGSISLPNLSKRLKLSFMGNGNLDNGDTKDQNIEDSVEEYIDAFSIRLQYSLLSRKNIYIRESVGVRFRNLSLFSGIRLRIRKELGGKWNTKFTQHLFWFTKDGWKSNSELTFNRIIGKHNLFRQTFRTAWSENKNFSEGFRFTLMSSFTQPLSTKAAFRYRWSSRYYTMPEPDWTSTTLSVRYRQIIWKDWLIFEFAPFVSWSEIFGWKANPGIIISITIAFEEEKITPKPKFNILDKQKRKYGTKKLSSIFR
jgi:hypothetical protein